MIYIIIIAVIVFFIYLVSKDNADIQNVNKFGGLKNKYKILIEHIMSRNSFYKLNEINSNNIELTNTGMRFKLIELDKKLQITWHWDSFVSGKSHTVQWLFDEFENQDEMYKKLDNDMKIQNLIDEGMTKLQAQDFLQITLASDKVEQEKLTDEFSKKHSDLWSKITN